MREFFLENSQIAVFISSSKSIMTARLVIAPGSARKQHSKNKKMLIFNLVSQYAQIADKQNYLQEVGGIMKL